jgi:hypothetical protein
MPQVRDDDDSTPSKHTFQLFSRKSTINTYGKESLRLYCGEEICDVALGHHFL